MRHWSEAERAYAKQLAQKGLNASQIGQELGRSQCAVLSQLRKHDCALGMRGNLWGSGETEKLRELIERGWSSTKIGEYLRRSRRSVIGRSWRLGLKIGPRVSALGVTLPQLRCLEEADAG